MHARPIQTTAGTTSSESDIDGVSIDDFKAAFRRHPGGVAVITASGVDGPAALTATSVVSVSVDPPLLVFSVSALSSTGPSIAGATSVVVHLVRAREMEIARLCATSGIDRFADPTMWALMPTGEPYFTGVQTRIRGRVVQRIPASGSTVMLVEAVEMHVPDRPASGDTGPLVYYDRTWHALGPNSLLE